MGCGCHCGSIRTIPAAAPLSPQEVIPAADIIAGWDAAVNVQAGGTVSVLPDVSGNGFNLSQANAALQPTWGAATGPNGNPAVLFDGVDDRLFNAVLDFPPPGTTPTTFWGVFRQVTWTDLDRFFGAGAGSSGLVLLQTGVTPTIQQANNVISNPNGGLILNTYTVVEVFFSNSTSDFIRAGSVLSTGIISGNIDPLTQFSMGSDGPGVFPSNSEFSELWAFRGPLTVQQRAQLRAYATARYGPIP